jgi:excisionase family DNA binding protein
MSSSANREVSTVDDTRMLRPAEAADALGVSLARLRRLAASGRLVTVRTLGGHRRYREDDVLALQRWLQRRAGLVAVS